jgi:hypothetical protein
VPSINSLIRISGAILREVSRGIGLTILAVIVRAVCLLVSQSRTSVALGDSILRRVSCLSPRPRRRSSVLRSVALFRRGVIFSHDSKFLKSSMRRGSWSSVNSTGQCRIREMSVCNLFDEVLSLWMWDEVNRVNPLCDLESIGVGEMWLQILKCFDNGISLGEIIVSSSNEDIKLMPNLDDPPSDWRIAAESGHKVVGCVV